MIKIFVVACFQSSQYDDELSFCLFHIVLFCLLMFEVFTNYRLLILCPSLQFTLCWLGLRDHMRLPLICPHVDVGIAILPFHSFHRMVHVHKLTKLTVAYKTKQAYHHYEPGFSC